MAGPRTEAIAALLATAGGMARRYLDDLQIITIAPSGAAGAELLVGSEDILEMEIAEAELRCCGPAVVHSWRYPEAAAPGELHPPFYDQVQHTEKQTARLADAVRVFADKYPECRSPSRCRTRERWRR